MRQVPLVAIPNQKLSVRLDDQRIVLRIKEARGVMVADLERGGVELLSGVRIVAGQPFIPYGYLENGNFIITTVNGELPWWQNFTVDQQLIYMTAAEVDALKASTVTAADFL